MKLLLAYLVWSVVCVWTWGRIMNRVSPRERESEFKRREA